MGAAGPWWWRRWLATPRSQSFAGEAPGNCIRSESTTMLGEVQAGTCALEMLDIGTAGKGLKGLVRNSTLTQLYLDQNTRGDEGAVKLAEDLANKQLRPADVLAGPQGPRHGRCGQAGGDAGDHDHADEPQYVKTCVRQLRAIRGQACRGLHLTRVAWLECCKLLAMVRVGCKGSAKVEDLQIRHPIWCCVVFK
jgi:hypothetical protein